MKKIISTALVAAGLVMASQAEAISITPLLMFASGNNNVQTITVSNEDTSTAYVQVTPKLIKNAGMPNSSITVYTPGGNPKEFGLMVSPLKLALPANTDRNIRLVALNTNPAQDQFYEVSITTIAPPAASTAAETVAGGSSANATIGISYAAKLLVLAKNPLPVVSAKRSGSTITITNTGNSYISLRNGQLCNTSGNNCSALPASQNYQVLFVGNSWSFTTSAPGVVKFEGVYAQDKSMSVSSN